MQIKIKKDLFGIKVMFLQILYVFAFLFCIAIGRTIFYTLSVPYVINFIWLPLAIVWGVLSTRRILMYKCICKELLGMCKEKFLIYITSISINLYSAIIIVFGNFGYNHLYNLLLLLDLIVMIALQFLEAICLDIHYLEYEHSEVTINCKDGRSVTCENILKINKKKNYLVVRKEDSEVYIKYDQISTVDYYGEKAYDLDDKLKKIVLGKLKRFEALVPEFILKRL